MHSNTMEYMKGLSSQVKLFPVCVEWGYGADDHTRFHDHGKEYADG